MTPEQTAFVQRAEESLRAAQLLYHNQFFNDAVSSAYYTMFYVASALLLKHGLTFTKHTNVLAAFGQHLVKTGEVESIYHRYLLEAEKARNKADYDVNMRISAENQQNNCNGRKPS